MADPPPPADVRTQRDSDGKPDPWQQWYWLLGWTALITVPQLVFYVFKGKSAGDKTATFNLYKDRRLLAMLVGLAALTPFIPLIAQRSGNDHLAGGADLTAVLLNVLALLTQMADQLQLLAQSSQVERKYRIADTLVRGMRQQSSSTRHQLHPLLPAGPHESAVELTTVRFIPHAVTEEDEEESAGRGGGPSARPRPALDNNVNWHYFGCLEDFRMGKMEGRHEINWDEHAKQLLLSSRLEEDFSKDNYGVRYRLVALFSVLQNNCSAPYCLSGAMFRQVHSALGPNGWRRFSGCSTLILEKAVHAAGVPDWQLALRDRKRMSSSEIAVSRLEMKLGQGLPELPGLEVFRDIAKVAESSNISNWQGLEYQAAEQVTYDLAVLGAELIVISDYLCCKRKQAACESDAPTPLAHHIMDEFFNDAESWNALRAQYDQADNLWLLWLLTALSIVPVLLVLVFCLLPSEVLQLDASGQQTEQQPDQERAGLLTASQRQDSLRQGKAPEHPVLEQTGQDACLLLALAIRTLMSSQSVDYLSRSDLAGASCKHRSAMLSVDWIEDEDIRAGLGVWQHKLKQDEIESARLLLNLGMRHTYAVFDLAGDAMEVRQFAPVDSTNESFYRFSQ